MMCLLIRFGIIPIATIASYVATSAVIAGEKATPPVSFAYGDGYVTVAIGGLPFAVYRYNDEKITRPYFAHVRAPSGVQVTRQHPPIEGQDLTDHDTFHPGIWMSFGDISGSDYWRIKARVRHAGYVEAPRGGVAGSFAVRNEYLDQNDPAKIVCTEIARYKFRPRPEGFLISWDSTFSSDHEFYFGDQEEMGLGLRIATPMRVGKRADDKVPAGNGEMRDSLGRKNEKEIWGNSSEWCDYSGTMAGQRLGMTIFTHPDNLRPSWFHARDYGVLEANQFGRKSFGKGEESKVVVKPGEVMRIRYGVLIHSGPAGSQPDLAAAYQDYLQFAGK
jgi:hypothetical protein